ncbi:stimulated by retinoic acid gene 8 protein homolog [Hyperolius riggenbachi]|uniref:stimulated by retinoic acid gene 8 protein homolog n=1 Tax=Hyperolius riggenbachi TaxID=752182 RepID=UPI0035A3C854
MDRASECYTRKINRRLDREKDLVRKHSKSRQDREKKGPARKRPDRSRKFGSTNHLFKQLSKIVFAGLATQATKRQVLRQAKSYIQELENTLDSLLKMRGRLQMEKSSLSSPCTLEEFKEEYLQQFCTRAPGDTVASTSEKPDDQPVVLYIQSDFEIQVGEEVEVQQTDKSPSPKPPYSPDLIEFERYLHFYRHTVDLLTERRLVSSEQVTQPSVSKAIASHWQDLHREGDAILYQHDNPQALSTSSFFTFTTFPGSTDGVKDNSMGSQEASSSFLSSTPEEILLEDAFDVASSFLDCRSHQTTSSPRSSFCESPEQDSCLYRRICTFLQSRLTSTTQLSSPHLDYEAVLLRCNETLDDEDDL